VKSKEDRIPRHGNWTLRSRNAEGKSEWSSKLASTKKCKESTKVSRAHELL